MRGAESSRSASSSTTYSSFSKRFCGFQLAPRPLIDPTSEDIESVSQERDWPPLCVEAASKAKCRSTPRRRRGISQERTSARMWWDPASSRAMTDHRVPRPSSALRAPSPRERGEGQQISISRDCSPRALLPRVLPLAPRERGEGGRRPGEGPAINATRRHAFRIQN